jgi:two-component sensor histidine kinase/CBS-domain-containing membrane protein
MLLQDSANPLPSLELVIDCRPLKVSAQTSVAEAISTLAKAQNSCNLPGLELSLKTELSLQARAAALWIVEGDRLLGQFSQADALREIAAGKGTANRSVAEVMSSPAVIARSVVDDFSTILSQLRQHFPQQLPVVDQQGQLLGVITPEGVRGVLQVDELLKVTSVEQVLQGPVVTALATDSALDLARQLAFAPTDTLILTQPQADGFSQPVGAVMARDFIQLQSLGLNLAELQGETIMQRHLLRLPTTESALSAYWRMQQQQVQRFIVDNAAGQWLGTVSPTSFLYTLDQPSLIQAHRSAKASVDEFAAERTALINLNASNPIEKLQKQLDSSRLLAAMALNIRQSLNLETILQTAVDEVRQFLQTDRVLIYQFHPDMSGTVVVESSGEAWPPALNSTVQDTCFGQDYAEAYKSGRTQVVDDIYTAGLSQCHINILVLFDVRASLVVPILQGTHLWGLLCAYHCAGPRHWQSYEVDLLNQFATHMAIAIQQSQLYQQAQVEIQERQRIEEQLTASLREKEFLLKEIHHRVKNNLQIISSVLRLQSDYIKDERVLTLFNDSQNRIRSMALIHEKLYKSRDLLQINMDDYIHDLTAGLIPSYGALSRSVDLQIAAGEINFNIDMAIPCGLIIHELVSNALKHAFVDTGNQENIIQVSINQSSDNNQYVLSVSDNGIGFPADLDFRSTESLGLELVCIFTEQLDGTIELHRQQGTCFVVTFPKISSLEERS